MLLVAALLAATAACGQWSFTLDTTFRTQIVDQNVNAIHVLQDGRIFASGLIRYAGDMSVRGSTRLWPNGSRDMTYTGFYGGERIIPWVAGKFYVSNGLPRRMMPDGSIDPSFGPIGIGPYYSTFTTGDYHVFPDGRVLLSGMHTLSDSIRGFVGHYHLVWFTNTGYLDTTRVHRQANGPIWAFTELPDGKFLCSCSCTQYEGQPVGRLFRVHADGSLDTTFNAGVNWGNIYAYHPLTDGRVYVGGRYKRAAAPNDTLYLARFMPDGSLDAGFNHLNRLSTLPGMTGAPKALRIYEWMEGRLFVTGVYQRVNGEPRGAICVVDSTGALTPYMDTCMPSAFSFQGSTNAAVVEMLPIPDGTGYYICGTYAGYDDGTTNDPQQRFVSRLLVSELTVGGEERPTGEEPLLRIHPNPARDQLTLRYEPGAEAQVAAAYLRDATGRLVGSIPLGAGAGQHTLSIAHLAPGAYTVQYLGGNRVVGTVPFLIQR